MDVEELVESGFQASPVLGPGDHVDREGSSEPGGMVGIALLHPAFGPVVTTAGHVVEPDGAGITVFQGNQRPRVRLTITGSTPAPPRQVLGRVVKVNRSEGEDYALIQADDPGLLRNLYRDELPLARPYSPDDRDLNASLFVLARSGMRSARVKGINLTVEVQGRRIDGALLTEKQTIGGDSGCPVIDSTSRVWGMLVGFAHLLGPGPCSVFTPAQHVVKVERSSFL